MGVIKMEPSPATDCAWRPSRSPAAGGISAMSWLEPAGEDARLAPWRHTHRVREMFRTARPPTTIIRGSSSVSLTFLDNDDAEVLKNSTSHGSFVR
jgi:hypothetical protein